MASGTESEKVVPIEDSKKKRKRPALDVMARIETIVAGGKEYQLTHLTMFQSREWRKSLGDLIRELGPKMSGVGVGNDIGLFLDNMATVFEEAPEDIFKLVCLYDTKLNWSEIGENIYPDELNTIFTQILEAVFPLAGSMSKAMGINLGMR